MLVHCQYKRALNDDKHFAKIKKKNYALLGDILKNFSCWNFFCFALFDFKNFFLTFSFFFKKSKRFGNFGSSLWHHPLAGTNLMTIHPAHFFSDPTCPLLSPAGPLQVCPVYAGPLSCDKALCTLWLVVEAGSHWLQVSWAILKVLGWGRSCSGQRNSPEKEQLSNLLVYNCS